MRACRIELDAPPWLVLAAEVLHRVPRLPGALRTGRPMLFDGDDATSRDAAIALCQQCPPLSACSDWLSALPRSRRPPGVVAGRYRGASAEAST